MSDDQKGPNRFSSTLTGRVRSGLVTRLSETPALSKVRATILKHAETGSKRLRQELLNLQKDEDMARWQILNNDRARYEVLSDNPSHQRGEFLTRIVYYERGDNLPFIKTIEDLRSEDEESNEESLE